MSTVATSIHHHIGGSEELGKKKKKKKEREIKGIYLSMEEEKTALFSCNMILYIQNTNNTHTHTHTHRNC